MGSARSKRYRLASFSLKKPGLLTLLFKRSFVVGMADYLFHLGIYGSIITGAIAELADLMPRLADFFNGFGWIISWAHGVTGAFLVVGGLGFLLRYLRNQHFRLAWGRIFYLDFLFMLVVAVTGILQAIPVFGLISVNSFAFYPLRWAASIHVTAIYVWIVASLFLGGAVRHALATFVWRLTGTEKKHAVFMAFSDACGRCGRCIEACPLYEATGGAEIEAPALKLRKYFKMIVSGSLKASQIKSIAEQTATCTMCGLCVGVCPFSFNFVSMYKELLAYANKLYSASPIVQNIAGKSA